MRDRVSSTIKKGGKMNDKAQAKEKTMDIEHWKREGFAFEARFPNEYDLWMNKETMQKLRRYTDGREWLSNLTTGKYELVQEMPNRD